ncbi:hypothetical protein FACS189419_05130 [Planctomycetales bacterium]|nr:hypothetical protein FACS189419_05130 [Planctomycetales bacterium]
MSIRRQISDWQCSENGLVETVHAGGYNMKRADVIAGIKSGEQDIRLCQDKFTYLNGKRY